MRKPSKYDKNSNKASKRFNFRYKNYCNKYWAKYIHSGYNGSFDSYLNMYHLF